MPVDSARIKALLVEVERLKQMLEGDLAEAQGEEARVGAVHVEGTPAPRTRLR